MTSIADRVKKIISEHLGAEPGKVTPGADLSGDLGADSLDLVEIVMAVEQAFGIKIPDDAADRVVTVGDAIALVERMVMTGSTAAAAAPAGEDRGGIEEAPSGVIALMIGADGHVWASATDFGTSGYGGFEPHRGQQIRARGALRHAFVRVVCNASIATAFDSYTVDRMVEDVLRRGEIREAFILIGHESARVHSREYINRDGAR